MFAANSERRNARGGSSSWDGGWNSYGNSSRDYGHNEAREDFHSPAPGRSYVQEESRSKDTVCQNFLQNKCTRGSSCPYQHPSLSGSKPRPLAATLNSKKLQNAWLNFCPDFQRGQCPYTDDCRLLHISKDDEREYQTSGDIATGVVEQAMSKSMVMDWAYIGNQPHCKDYLQGSCNLKDCRLRHLNIDQYVVEVLQALREKFEMNVGSMYSSPPTSNPQKSRGGGQIGNNHNDQYGESRGGGGGGRRGPGAPMTSQETDRYDSRRGPSHSRDSFEPEAKRLRSQDGMRHNTGRQGGNGYSPSDESFLEKLRRDNVDLTIGNENVKKTARMVEDENADLRKALRLALDLNAFARSLPEFRGQLRDLMSSLRKKGYHPEMRSNSSSWDGMQMKPF